MLICRFNGVAWFHDVHTIAHHCEKQVVFPVEVSNIGLSLSHGPCLEGPRPRAPQRCCVPQRHIQTLVAPKTADREDAIPPARGSLLPYIKPDPSSRRFDEGATCRAVVPQIGMKADK